MRSVLDQIQGIENSEGYIEGIYSFLNSTLTQSSRDDCQNRCYEKRKIFSPQIKVEKVLSVYPNRIF